jgi:hypothetical protein
VLPALQADKKTGRGATGEARPALVVVAHVSFALYMAYCGGTSVQDLAARLALPIQFIEERIEAARLCLLAGTVIEQMGTSTFYS